MNFMAGLRLSARLVLLVAAGMLVVLGCAHAPFCQGVGEVYPDKPFELEVRLGATEAMIGSSLHVEYVLTNTSVAPIGACPLDWDEHHFIGTTGNRGLVHTSTGSAPEANVVRLAAGTSLMWARDVEVPDVGVGRAKFIGIFNSWCSLWSGRVMSKPVELMLVSHSTATGR
jgi:hypothetical protein